MNEEAQQLQEFYKEQENLELSDEEAEELESVYDSYGIEIEDRKIARMYAMDRERLSHDKCVGIIESKFETGGGGTVFKVKFFGIDDLTDANEKRIEARRREYENDPNRAIQKGIVNEDGEPIWREKEAEGRDDREAGAVIRPRYVQTMVGIGYPVEDIEDTDEDYKKKVRPITLERWSNDKEDFDNFKVRDHVVEITAGVSVKPGRYRLYDNGTGFKKVDEEYENSEIISEAESMTPAEYMEKFKKGQIDNNEFVVFKGMAFDISENNSGTGYNVLLRGQGEELSCRISGVPEPEFGELSDIKAFGQAWIPNDEVKDKGSGIVMSNQFYGFSVEDMKGPENFDKDEMEEKSEEKETETVEAEAVGAEDL